MSLKSRHLYNIIFVILFTVFCFFDVKQCFAQLVFKSWEKNVNITDYGEEVTEKITATVDLPRNKIYTGWAYIFDKSEKIELVSARSIPSKSVSFNNNTLKFQFKKLENKDNVTFFIKYKKFIEQETSFITSRYIDFPDWANGAVATLTIQVPENMMLYSFHQNLNEESSKRFYWHQKLSNNQYFKQTLLLTPTSATWRVQVSGNAIGDDNFTKAKLVIPEYFKDGPYTINDGDLKLLTNTANTYKVKTENGYHYFDFSNVNSRLLSARVDAVIRNGEEYEKGLPFHPYKFMEYNTGNKLKYSTIINSIRNDNSAEELDDYIKIAMWVHNHLKYDKDLIDKKMSPLEIINARSGVCSHYSILYTELMRSIGVPALSVAGLSYNPKNKSFENHSWVYVFKGRWIPVDPTWGIYSGKLPVSHIYIYPNIDNIGVEFTAYNYKLTNTIKTDIRSTVDFIK